MLLKGSQSNANLEHVSSSGQASADVIWAGITVCQLNVEGLTKAKTNIIEHLIQTHKVTAILLQETHTTDSSLLRIPSFDLAAHTKSDIHGIATFIKNTANWHAITISPPDSIMEWAVTCIEGVTVVNVSKSPTSWFHADSIPNFGASCIYAGDFNSHSTTWGWPT